MVINDPIETHDGKQRTLTGFKKEVNDLVKSFCNRPNTLCLVVSNADMDLACNIGYAMVKDVGKVDSSIFILTKPDTLINLPMHEAQIEKFKNRKNVFMVLNRDGSTADDKKSDLEWTTKESNFFANLLKVYPMYQPHAKKLGVTTLVKELSYRLSRCIMDTSNYSFEIMKRREEERVACKMLEMRLETPEPTLMQVRGRHRIKFFNLKFCNLIRKTNPIRLPTSDPSVNRFSAQR